MKFLVLYIFREFIHFIIFNIEEHLIIKLINTLKIYKPKQKPKLLLKYFHLPFLALRPAPERARRQQHGLTGMIFPFFGFFLNFIKNCKKINVLLIN